MERSALFLRNALHGRVRLVYQAALIALVCAIAATASAQRTPGPGERGPEKPPAETPLPAVAQIGPARELKLAEFTWFRFGAQVQAWAQAQQDRLKQPDGGDGSFAWNFLCRRCRFFATGSIVKDVYFNVLFESANVGRADPVTGAKGSAVPQILDAYGQVKFADWFWISGGSILMPLTRNGLQPTTTYVSIDNANIDTTPVAQGNSNVLRDLGFQANGFFLANHLEYRVGVWQGSRQPATPTQSAGHNGPRVIAMASLNFWDPETGYVNGGHYYGTRKVVGVMANFDTQLFTKRAPSLVAGNPGAGVDKNGYYGVSGAAFINYPVSGTANPRGGDELVGLLQFGYYDGGLRVDPISGAPTNFGTYPLVPKQINVLAEAGYYNHGLHLSFFGKFEIRKISDDFPVTTVRGPNNQLWIAGGLKYFVAFPANFMNFALQYERIQNYDAPDTQQKGTHNITFAMQTLLY